LVGDVAGEDHHRSAVADLLAETGFCPVENPQFDPGLPSHFLIMLAEPVNSPDECDPHGSFLDEG